MEVRQLLSQGPHARLAALLSGAERLSAHLPQQLQAGVLGPPEPGPRPLGQAQQTVPVRAPGGVGAEDGLELGPTAAHMQLGGAQLFPQGLEGGFARCPCLLEALQALRRPLQGLAMGGEVEPVGGAPWGRRKRAFARSAASSSPRASRAPRAASALFSSAHPGSAAPAGAAAPRGAPALGAIVPPRGASRGARGARPGAGAGGRGLRPSGGHPPLGPLGPSSPSPPSLATARTAEEKFVSVKTEKTKKTVHFFFSLFPSPSLPFFFRRRRGQ